MPYADEEERKYLRPYRGKEADAISQNIVLERGEIFIEYSNNGIGTGIGRMKMGDGTTPYRSLKYLFNQFDLTDSDIANSLIKTIGSAGSTVDSTLMNKLSATATKMKDIVAVEKQLFQNRINNEGSLNGTISQIVTKLDQNATSVSKLWSTVVTTTGTGNQGNGSNNGTGGTGTANESLKTDKNTLWSTVFNNSGRNNVGNGTNQGTTQINYGNAALRSDINSLWTTVFNNTNNGVGNKKLRDDLNASTLAASTLATRVGTLETTVFTTTGTGNTGTGQNQGTGGTGTANNSLLTDKNTLWSTVFNNTSGGVGNKRLRDDLNAATATLSKNATSVSTLWSTVIASASLNNQKLRDDIDSIGGGSTALATRVGTLETTVFTTTGTGDRGNGSNNGTGGTGTANESLKTDKNTLWSTVFNNEAGGIGNKRLRSDLNASTLAASTLSTRVGTLETTVFTTTGTGDKGNGRTNGTGGTGTANESLKTDKNTLWSTVFNNSGRNTEALPGGGRAMATVSNAGNYALRDDINSLWLYTMDNENMSTGKGNWVLDYRIKENASSISNLGASMSTVYSKTITTTGTGDRGNGSNNGTGGTGTANESLKTDKNTLWSTVFNNVSNGIGNKRLRTDLKNIRDSVHNLFYAVPAVTYKDSDETSPTAATITLYKNNPNFSGGINFATLPVGTYIIFFNFDIKKYSSTSDTIKSGVIRAAVGSAPFCAIHHAIDRPGSTSTWSMSTVGVSYVYNVTPSVSGSDTGSLSFTIFGDHSTQWVGTGVNPTCSLFFRFALFRIQDKYLFKDFG